MAISTVSFDYFDKQYQDKKLYNIPRLDQADKYLLGEMHAGKKCNPTNGEFISFLASKYFVICFVESYECMKEILDESVIQSIMKVKNIAPEVRNKMRFFGWDAQYAQKKRSYALMNQLSTKCTSHEIYREFLNNMTEESSDFISKIDPVKASEVLQNHLPYLLSGLENNLPDVKKNSAEIQSLRSQYSSEIRATFPMRTACMVTSLNQAQVLDPSETKMVWICGLTHLIERTNRAEENLGSLRKELQNHNAVAMIPNLIHVTEEPSVAEQMDLIKAGKKPTMNRRALEQDPEILVKEWEKTIDRIKNMLALDLIKNVLTKFSSDGSHVT
jgi:hypothetical protein